MRCAVIDVGTNSVKFVVGERSSERALADVVDRAEVTRLGEGQEADRVRSAGAVARTQRRSRDGREARAPGATQIAAVATAE